ncbi:MULTISPECIES: peroxiredoxin family protein [Butyricimonas]|uniref:peroxiredoxin family protein n=1 Tax=Butyricimonas TaxID=574697 RepID=UPI0016524FBF|nr:MULTISPECIES: redoxin domain-containing protein [Butyricimonas]
MRSVVCCIVACFVLLQGELYAQTSYPEIKKIYENVDGSLSIDGYTQALQAMDARANQLVSEIDDAQERGRATLLWHTYQRENIFRFWQAIGRRPADLKKLRSCQLSTDPDVPELELLSPEELKEVLDWYFRVNKSATSYVRMKECLYGIKSEKVRQIYAFGLLERELQVNGMSKDLESVFEVFRCCMKNREIVERVNEWEKMYAPVQENAHALEIELPDDKGNIFRLTDFQEKYVFICVWALDSVNGADELDTFAEARKVNEKWGEAGIVFVNIAVGTSENMNKWRKILTEKKQTEWMINLFCDKAKSAFVKDYVIDSLPRYIFVDMDNVLRSGWFISPANPSLFKQVFTKNLFNYKRVGI